MICEIEKALLITLDRDLVELNDIVNFYSYLLCHKVAINRRIEFMKKMYLFLGALIVAASLVSCGVNLSQKEAEKLLSEHFGYPEPVMTVIDDRYGLKIRNGVQKILTDGYAYHNPKASDGSWNAALVPDYLPTDKGKEFIEKIRFNELWGYFTYVGAVVQESLISIDEILIDEESKTALIKYTTKYEPIEPFYSAICLDKRCEFFAENIHKKNQRKARFKKYDKGWRVIR